MSAFLWWRSWHGAPMDIHGIMNVTSQGYGGFRFISEVRVSFAQSHIAHVLSLLVSAYPEK